MTTLIVFEAYPEQPASRGGRGKEGVDSWWCIGEWKVNGILAGYHRTKLQMKFPDYKFCTTARRLDDKTIHSKLYARKAIK